MTAHPEPFDKLRASWGPELAEGPVEGWIGRSDPAAHPHRWEVLDLGEIDYGQALALQEKCRDAVEAGHPGFWLFLQHPPVVTTGRRNESMADLTCGAEALRDLGVQFARTDRGGRLTFHHPGQIVGYPILCLRRERWKLCSYIDRLAAIIAEALAPFGIDARFRPDHPGLWVDVEGVQRKVSVRHPPSSPSPSRGEGKREGADLTFFPSPSTGEGQGGGERLQKKIASIGVHVRRSVTTHGFALNVLRPALAVPGLKMCGLAADRITSMEDLLAYTPDLHKVKQSLMNATDRMDDPHA